MTPTLFYAEEALVRQITVEYLERELNRRLVYASNNKDFRSGKSWHWYERWVDVVRKYCRESGGEYKEKSI